MKELEQLIESAAEQAVLLDPSDLPGMAMFSKLLREIVTAFESASLSDSIKKHSVEASEKAASLVEKIIFEEADDPVANMKVVGGCVAALQAVSRGRDIKEAEFPAELNLTRDISSSNPQTEPDKSSESASMEDADSSTEQLNLVVDDTLFMAYLEQQYAALSDMEEAVLAFERDGKPESLAAMRRILHTMKGEAGVVGVNDISSFCHSAEECLDESDISADLLFDIKDWLDNAVKAYAKGEKPDAPPDLSSPTSEENQPAPASAASEHSVEDDQPNAPLKKAPEIYSSFPISERDFTGEFIEESQEHFDSADSNLLTLENDPENADAISAVFRAFHTIKGLAGFLSLKPFGDLAHEAETLLDDVRKKKRRFEGQVVDLVFSSLDMLKTMIFDLREALSNGKDMMIRPELHELIKELKAMLTGNAENDNGVVSQKERADEKKMPEMPQEDSSALGQTDETISGKATPDRDGRSAGKSVEVAQTMKVDAVKIDQLLDTIGELVIAESVVAGDSDIKNLKSLSLEKNMALLSKITRSLQDLGMSMRLIPIDTIFRKMARLVRDLSKKSRKKVNFIIEGGDTEIDKGMVDKLGDPLVHMIRNSMDHGIENEDIRKAQGKPLSASIVLRAFHQGGSIHIEIEDDGKGLDRNAIVAKAIEKELLATDAGLSDQEVFALIFEAGFSTAKQVTEISGRGVGMDVVRRNIEDLRGKTQVRSQPGQGSIFTIVLPLTTAIIDGMLVQTGQETYVVPTLSIVESFRPDPGMIHVVSGRGEAIGFRGALLSLIRLSRLFGIPDATEEPSEAIVIVFEDAGRQWAILVDEILGQQQVVIKSLGKAITKMPGISGACIMADGRPGLIIDVGGVVRMATEV